MLDFQNKINKSKNKPNVTRITSVAERHKSIQNNGLLRNNNLFILISF